MRATLIVLILSVCCLCQAQKTYYVAATNGKNSNPGTKDSPWATLVFAVGNVERGDTIYLLPGTHNIDIQVRVPEGVNITGAGETSIIHSNITGQWGITLLYHSSREGTKGNQSLSYVKLDGGNATAWQAVQVNARSNVEIHHVTVEHFFFQGIIISGTVSQADAPQIYATGNSVHDCTFNDCSDYSAENGQGQLMIGGQDGILIYNNSFIQTSRSYRRNGYNLKYYSNGHFRGMKIYNNTFVRAVDTTNYAYYDFSMELWAIEGGCEIYNNTMTGGIDLCANPSRGGNPLSVLPGNYGYGVKVYNNIIGPADTAIVPNTTGIYLEFNTDNVLIERNLIRNVKEGIVFTPSPGGSTKNITIRYNIIRNISDYAIYNLNHGVKRVASNISIYNNVFYVPEKQRNLFGVAIFTIGKADHINISNNIFQGFDYAAIYGNGSEGQTVDHLTIRNNILFKNGSYNNIELVKITPTNFINDGNLKDDPKFCTQNNFHLKRNSPAIRAGVKIEDNLLDFDGVKVGNRPNIGCYETIEGTKRPENR
ncbi:MAG TPA: right-handed parallel beta-helix repeat-containing protein [Bacteroidales bacterium]|nr:right-handed parallel beta-helix repeat-containing protein [Bacteroidales bacterium]HPT20318.1 right-handed parallel beta-helix repeat-containing protein [Bacteroidales bacterium]